MKIQEEDLVKWETQNINDKFLTLCPPCIY
jgi:hypothetical protein